MKKFYFENPDSLEKLIVKLPHVAERLQNENKIKNKNVNALKDYILKTYGAKVLALYETKIISIGMPSTVFELIKGKPLSINITKTSDSTNEQWIYPNNNYYYFENGKLAAIQEIK